MLWSKEKFLVPFGNRTRTVHSVTIPTELSELHDSSFDNTLGTSILWLNRRTRAVTFDGIPCSERAQLKHQLGDDLQSLLIKAGILPHNSPWPYIVTSDWIHYSLIISPFNATDAELLTVSLNKPQIKGRILQLYSLNTTLCSSGGMAPCICNLDTRWSRVLSVTLYVQGKIDPGSGWVGPMSGSGHCSYRESNADSSSPLPGHYTDWAIRLLPNINNLIN
jgi:hypothetical protein